MGMSFLTNRSAPAVAAPSESTGVEMALLWENGLPGNAFAAQTVKLDFTGYEMCMIEYNYNTSNPTLMMSQIAKIETGNLIRLFTAEGASSNGLEQRRDNTFVDGGISFGAGYRNGSSSNIACIPVRVYGVKGVTWVR